jgi:hypothetical protein
MRKSLSRSILTIVAGCGNGLSLTDGRPGRAIPEKDGPCGLPHVLRVSGPMAQQFFLGTRLWTGFLRLVASVTVSSFTLPGWSIKAHLQW